MITTENAKKHEEFQTLIYTDFARLGVLYEPCPKRWDFVILRFLSEPVRLLRLYSGHVRSPAYGLPGQAGQA